jgi:hypothetical protein
MSESPGSPTGTHVSPRESPPVVGAGPPAGSNGLAHPQTHAPAARKLLNTKALALGICSGVAGAGLALPAAANAATDYGWWVSKSACCSTRHFDTQGALASNSAALAELPNWEDMRHNAHIWECAQGRKPNGQYTSIGCGSAYSFGAVSFRHTTMQGLCWTNSNNIGGVSHQMTCLDFYP